jgi:hypothetical protein
MFTGTLLLCAIAAVAAPPSPAPCVPDAKTVLLLHLDGDTADASTYNRTGLAETLTFVNDGVINQALHLDGKTQTTIPAKNQPDLSAGFTVEAWLRFPRPESPRFGHVIELPGTFSWAINTYERGRAKIDFAVQTSEGRATMKTVEYIPCSIWVHVACRYDPEAAPKERLSLFVNGLHTDRLTRYQARTVPAGKLSTPSSELVLGRGFVGDIDELRVSAIARPQADLAGCWLSGVSGVFDREATLWTAQPKRPDDYPRKAPWVDHAMAIPTFEAIGVRLAINQYPTKRNASAQIRYRAGGKTKWQRGMDLVPAPRDPELRGSLIGLAPDTLYEIEVTPFFSDNTPSPVLRLQARTWPEDIPIARVIRLSAGVIEEPLTIQKRGKPDGWIKIAPPEGEETTISAGNQAHGAIRIAGAAYIILERVTVRGGIRHGIEITDSHHIRVRCCDISGWGREGIRGNDGIRRTKEGQSINIDAGVYIGPGSRQVVAEHNFMHAPRGSANSWEFGHPLGPQGLVIAHSKGNHVVRYNDMIGSQQHWWNDAIESCSNGAVSGGPYRDTDIYGNTFFFANDDGTELDGGQINVRYHHNWVEKTLCGVSCAPCISGPSYVYRNVFAHLGDERGHRGSGFKMGGGPRFSPGRNIIFHNTVYGRAGGLRSVGFGRDYSKELRGGYNALSRNNLFAGPSATADDVSDTSPQPVSSFDYDLLGRGGARVGPGNEKHAVRAKPTFADEATGDYRLTPNSQGVDVGIHIPGMNDQYDGAAPDMGAFETSAAQAFPPRPHGLTLSPPRIVRTRFVGSDEGTEATVTITVPHSAGASWQALPNDTWLRCIPTGGPCTGEPTPVHICWDIDSPGDGRPRRAAVTFRTNRGYVRTIPVDVHVLNTPREILIEGEDGMISGDMTMLEDADASGGRCVHTPIPAKPPEGAARTTSKGAVSFQLNVPTQATYHLAARALAPTPSGIHDSFYVTMDGGEPIIWHVRVGPRWDWALLDHSWDLSPGPHTLVVQSRESGTQLDQILLTNNRHAGPLKP